MYRSAVCLVLTLFSVITLAEKPAYIAIIIDDIGHNKKLGLRALNLPGLVTVAILPDARFARSLSERAHTVKKEVIVHLPMTNLTNHPIGPGALTGSLNKKDFLATLANAIGKVPYAKGINNHTGSYLTQQTVQMTWLMDAIKRRNFFFIDSRTTPNSVAGRIAREKNILTSSRDVFLDNEQSYFEIDRAFRKLIRVAKIKGTAIAIGHPYKTTLDYLEMAIPLLARQNVIIMPASNLIALQQIQRMEVAALAAE